MGQTVNLLTYVFGGSNPSAPTIQNGLRYILDTRKCGSSSAGRAIAFQAIGREFEPRLPLHLKKANPIEVRTGFAFWGLQRSAVG